MKFKYLFTGLLLNIVLIVNVSAATLEIKAKEKAVINNADSAVILVNIKDVGEEEINQVEFDLAYNKDLLSVKPLENEFGYSQNINKDNIFINKAKKNFTDGSIISFNVTNLNKDEIDMKEDFSITNVKINDTALSEEEAAKIMPLSLTLKKQITTTTRALNTSAELKTFKVNYGTIKPAFSKDVKEYKIYIDKDTIRQVTITPEFEQTGVQMEVECTLGCSSANPLNKLNLTQGKNEATFTFTSEDGKNKNEYKFIIYRGPTTDGSNLLSSLAFEEDVKINEKFDKSNLDYTATVPFETEKLTVVATPEDANADVSIKGNDKLEVGENVITITVTSAETMEKKIYNITVTKEEEKKEEENATEVAPIIEKQEPQKKNNLKLIIIIGVISTLIIALSAYFIFFYKGKKKPSKVVKEDLDSTVTTNKAFIDEEKEPTSVDDALKDLMQTKEINNVNDEPTDF